MRLPIACFLLFAAAAPALAQGLPPQKEVERWESMRNQRRLSVQWDVPPPYEPRKLPDGSTQPPRAPWPFLLYVSGGGSKGSDKLSERVFADTSFVLCAHAVKPIRISPVQAIDLPYLASVQGIVDPTILVLDRDFKLVGMLNSQKDFTPKKVLALMVKAADSAYTVKLARYVKDYFDILEEEEKLWKGRKQLEEKAERYGDKDPGARDAAFAEIEQAEKALDAADGALADREAALKASLTLIPDAEEALPATVGTGRNKRPLTPAEKEAIETFREFRRDQNPIVRAAAVEDLGGVDSPVMVELILEAANDVDPMVVTAAGKGLARMKSPESLDAMTAGLSSGNDKAKLAALIGFAEGGQRYPAAVPHLVRHSQSGGDEHRRAAIIALGKQDDPAAVPALVAALGDRLPGLRVLAANALGDLDAETAAAPLIALIESKDWSLQKAAVEALAKIRVKESVEPLLRAFEKSEGLILEVLYKALVAITGQDFQYRPESWRKWWDRYGSGFQVPTEAEIEKAREIAAKALEGYAKPDKRKYDKIETLSRRMVFVLDISASMADKITIPPEMDPAEISAQFPSRVKMDIAKKQLIDLLATLDGNVYFNIITFAGRVDAWRDGLVNGSQRNAAIKYVNKIKPVPPPSRQSSGDESMTNTYGALTAALGLTEDNPDWKGRSEVDTIFLVTDGIPTTGKIIETPKVVQAIRELNATRGVVIHVIVFDPDAGRKLRGIAEQNGGQLVVVGPEPKAK